MTTRKREDFADEAAWLAWQQTQLELKRAQQSKPTPEPKQRTYSSSWVARARRTQRKGASPRISHAYEKLANDERRATALAQDPDGFRAQHAAYNRDWARANPEKSRAIGKRWRDKHPELVRYNARHKAQQWRINHPEYERARKKQWREENREHIAEYNRAYRARKKAEKAVAA